MDYIIPEHIQKNAKVLMQRSGYHEFIDPNTGKVSYIRRLGAEFYPRFHVYIKETEDDRTIALHLDQKHVSYEGQKMHGGEYDGPVVEEEIERLKVAIEKEVLIGLSDNTPARNSDSGGILTQSGPKSLRDKLGI